MLCFQMNHGMFGVISPHPFVPLEHLRVFLVSLVHVLGQCTRIGPVTKADKHDRHTAGTLLYHVALLLCMNNASCF